METKNVLTGERVRVRRAFISVHNKDGLVRFAALLAGKGIELYATEGTASYLREASIAVRPAHELTGFAEVLSGKVKSLSPRLHAAILFSRASSEERRQIEKEGLLPVDMVVVNFYPFHEVADETSLSEATKMIDIGGPAALRAAAKNFRWVVPVPEPASYDRVTEEMLKDEPGVATDGGSVSLQLSLQLAALTFATTARYERLIENYLLRQAKRLAPQEGRLARPSEAAVEHSERVAARPADMTGTSPSFPEDICLRLRKVQELRYGENPHQAAGFYVGSGAGEETRAVLGADENLWGRQLQGKELSFNNLLDLDAATCAVREFEAPACVIVKHRSPCGVSQSPDLLNAYRRARDCDPLSAFGGVLAVNRPLTDALAIEMSRLFLELVAAPSFEPGAVEAFSRKKNLRLLEFSSSTLADGGSSRVLMRSAAGGVLLQKEDSQAESSADWRLVSKRALNDADREGLLFLWKVARHVVSNAIVIGNGERTLGIGAGQTSRVDAVEVALMKAARAGHDVKGAWLASDGFFPFRDSIDVAARAGIRAIVEPGGSIRDEECIAAADEHGVAMYFTGRRCFKH
ncbi:MAG: bifunctional phosphoribosylaminoimidazolecarboxamide formyltransferase/IMP cyclohydrolase [Candidatus Eisenbacteria bacterium]|nr:bifunctional phosphoribosylaminoimidazolecarboxamide formyltransferase/IMP cyclohydrolase [Candidatus Eisenbacteria bacterium]